MSATIRNAYRRSLRVKILAKAQAKVEAKAKATTPARASGKDGDKDKTRVKVDEEEALMKRYPEPMAHGLEACEPSHPCGSR